MERSGPSTCGREGEAELRLYHLHQVDRPGLADREYDSADDYPQPAGLLRRKPYARGFADFVAERAELPATDPAATTIDASATIDASFAKLDRSDDDGRCPRPPRWWL